MVCACFQIRGEFSSNVLKWIPSKLPSNVRIVTSLYSGSEVRKVGQLRSLYQNFLSAHLSVCIFWFLLPLFLGACCSCLWLKVLLLLLYLIWPALNDTVLCICTYVRSSVSAYMYLQHVFSHIYTECTNRAFSVHLLCVVTHSRHTQVNTGYFGKLVILGTFLFFSVSRLIGINGTRIA